MTQTLTGLLEVGKIILEKFMEISELTNNSSKPSFILETGNPIIV
jgi:hypothetical protein